MEFSLDGLKIYFPYSSVYQEQLNFMKEIKLALDTGDHTIVSTYKDKCKGSTVAMLSLLVSYAGSKFGESKQILYCTKDSERSDKIMKTLKFVYDHRCTVLGGDSPSILAVEFSSRKEFCINSDVIEESKQYDEDAEKDEDKLVAGCREHTASWIREVDIEDVCSFFDKAEGVVLSPGIYDIKDLVDTGNKHGWCPYFATKQALQTANVIVFGYENVLVPKIAGVVCKELKMNSNSIVIFDNADDVAKLCREALSVVISLDTVIHAERNIEKLTKELESANKDRLRMENKRLMNGVKHEIPLTDIWLANPALPEHLIGQPMPNEICVAENFLQHLNHLFFDERLSSLLRTLKIDNTDTFLSIQKVCHFATLWGTYLDYYNEFRVETGPCSSIHDDYPSNENIVKLACIDNSLVFKSVLGKFSSVCITLKEGPANSFITKMKLEALFK
ncbi:general transcription and DNA repair factor IIH helicase subunit XPD-like [Vicia villosa]|uniref:general transcription and DNA repair factor IIH helicase subunit XPD-like n=1 Tax=Vicia villosa TaxID=3911 RepID=UPI00273C463F|nr:general transcription and DNA repair factor IIH helicase subunit XPD-like [Vicia villosa]